MKYFLTNKNLSPVPLRSPFKAAPPCGRKKKCPLSGVADFHSGRSNKSNEHL